MTMQNTLNSLPVFRSKKDGTLYIPLPAERADPISGGCDCDHCKAQGEGYVPRWDTLAIPATPQVGSQLSHTWTVHFPQLQTLKYNREFVERI